MEVVIIIILLFIVSTLLSTTNGLRNKINYMDRKLDNIIEHLGIENNELDEELMELINYGAKILAIKTLRERTGMGLKEAKEYVDRLESK